MESTVRACRPNTLRALMLPTNADQAVTPSNQQYNSDTYKVITELVNKDQNGAAVALRLLAHKIQSPLEREALSALSCLEVLAKKGSPLFLSELGKFKFLNELIKVLSPKYLGEQTALSVKRKCTQLLCEWNSEYGSCEPKFTEAFNMLCKQGLINPETTQNGNTPSLPSRVPTERHPNIFDRSQDSQKLAKLLRSRNPADVAEANRLIKKIVEEDQVRIEKVTQRSTEMEALKNNTLLLQEMISTFQKGGASEAELDLMSELAQNIRTARPALYNFSLTHDENDIETLTEIARICDHASSALEFYETRVKGQVPSVQPAVQTNGQRSEKVNRQSGQPAGDLLSQDLLLLGLDNDETCSTNPPCTDVLDPLNQLEYNKKLASSKYEELEDIFSSLSSTTSAVPAPQFGNNPILTFNAKPVTTSYHDTSSPSHILPTQTDSSNAKMFDDLDLLGRQMLGLSTHPSASTSNSTTDQHTTPSTSLPSTQPTAECSINPPMWSDLDVPLSAIRPHPTITEPLVLYPSDVTGESSVQLVLRYTSNEPAPNVKVFVATVTSQSPLPVTDLHMRFGVSKPLSLRQLSASGHSLAAYSPFLPASAINQVILIFNPTHQQSVPIKFQLSFNLDSEAVLESGKAELSFG